MSFKNNTFQVLAAAATVAVALAAAVPATAIDPNTAADIALAQREVYRDQAPGGDLTFGGSAGWLSGYPMLATLCLQSDAAAPNAAFVSQTASSVARYYNHLFGTQDRNGNLLIERDGVEDIAFNALLALDMQSLARLEVRIKRPYQALFWYEGSRAVEDAVVASGFDRGSYYFFPTNTLGGWETKYHALSIAPLLFPGRVGDNHAAMIIRRHVFDPEPRAPESPFESLGGAVEFDGDDSQACESLFKTSVLLYVLTERGFATEAATFRAQAAERARRSLAAVAEPSAYHRYLAARLFEKSPPPLHDPMCALDVFEGIVTAVRPLDDAGMVRFAEGVDDTRALVAGTAGTSSGELTRAEESVRGIYQVVSTVRELLDAKSLLPSEAYRAIGGMDPARAVEHLLDDVTLALRRAENVIFRERRDAGGLQVTATLLEEGAIVGGTVRVRWSLSTQTGPLSIESATMLVGDQSATVVAPGDSVLVRPGETVSRVATFSVDQGRPDALQPFSLTLDIDAGTPGRIRYHALGSVFLEHPVTVLATFPEGRMLSGDRLPIDVTMVKRTNAPATIRYEWYSPTGLGLEEGKSAEYTMAAEADTTTLGMHVMIPRRCRPGRFPFKLKFYGDGTDLGTITSTFFRPYHWAVVGPFTPGAEFYPPEEGVDLLAEYESGDTPLAWKAVGDRIYTHEGDISLSTVMPKGRRGGVAFLYTVIDAPEITTAPVFISSNAPAVLFINGKPKLDVAGDRTPSYVRAELLRGPNSFLVKVNGNAHSTVTFTIGDENDETTYGFDNTMNELALGYFEIARRALGHDIPEDDAQKLVTLRYRDPGAHTVSVIGTFNGWSPERTPMHRLSSGVWEIVLSLPPGKHAYRFLVNNREQVVDPENGLLEPDGFGGENSILYVE